MDTIPNRPKAYSYVRFSSAEQAQGDSLRRQTEAARKYADHNGLELADLTFHDLGISAFRGKNVMEGALGAFIQAVDSGKVESGSFLLVENLDRLSRDKIMSALTRFADLLGKGIRIVTLTDGQEYDSESINSLTGLIVPLVTMSRANEESERKSKLLRAAWREKKKRAAANGEILTSWAPAWLRVRDGKFEVIEDRAKVVRLIFDLTLRGVGYVTIARKLNADKVPVFGKSNGWHHSYVSKILNNPAVVGTFQPNRTVFKDGKRRRVPDGDPITKYFPAVVEESVFFRVKHSKPGPSGKGAATPRNELNGLVFCGRCGGKMHYISKGPPPKGAAYLACDAARRKLSDCEAKSVRYEIVITHVLAHLTDYRSFHEASTPSATDYGHEIEGLAAKIAKVEGAIARLLDTLERVPSASAEGRLAEHESRLGALQGRKIEIEELATIGDRGDDFEKLLDGAQWVDAMEPDDLNLAFLHRVKEIRRVVERIEIEKDKPIRVTPRSSGVETA